MIFAVPLVPTTSMCSTSSTGDGDVTATQPATGAVDCGSENTTSFVIPFGTEIVRRATPASDATVTMCSVAVSPSITSGDRPRDCPSIATRRPGGSVTIDTRPGATGATGERSKCCAT